MSALSCAPLFLRLRNVSLVALETPVGPGWSSDPLLTFGRLPRRAFVDAETSDVRLRTTDGATLVHSLPGAHAFGTPILRAGESSVGRLTLTTDSMQVTYDVGERALERGILIGRYARCQVNIAADQRAMSRVHVLILRAGDDLLAIDTASSNGMRLDGRYHRILRLNGRTRLELADGTHLGWWTLD